MTPDIVIVDLGSIRQTALSQKPMFQVVACDRDK